MSRARVIVRYGIGVDNVDLDAARARQIPVCNVPDYCIDEVADHTLAFILATTRQVVPKLTPAQGWQAWTGHTARSDAHPAPTDHRDCRIRPDRTRGRRTIASRSSVAYSRMIPRYPRRRSKSTAVSRSISRAFSRESDLITLHCPSTAQTRGMINRETLGLMRPGVILINVARGDLVDSTALTEALRQGHVAAAALDVFDPEPIPSDHPILRMDNVIVASHIASASVAAVRKLRETAANLALAALRGEPLKNVVNGVTRDHCR